MSEGTPRPWAKNNTFTGFEYDFTLVMSSDQKVTVAEFGEEEDADVALHAVNTYDEREALIRELVAALKALSKRMQNMLDEIFCDCDGPHICGKPATQREVRAAVNALAKARQVLDAE